MNFEKGKLQRIDGNQSLLNCIGEDNFIRLAIQSSYFFSDQLVDKRFKEIANAYCNGVPLPVRNIGRKLIDDPLLIPDDNGNAKVCSVINKECGIPLNRKIQDKPLVNFIISHIWGNTNNPLFYTAFWNIVLIPAWANHLMDKNESAGTLSSKLKSTIQAILIDYNNLNSKAWGQLGHINIPKVAHPADVLHDTYELQIIDPLGHYNSLKPNAKVGQIRTVTVLI